MLKRAIAVDSLSSMHYYPNKHNIRILPMHIYFEEKEFLDVTEISFEHFLKWKRENPTAKISTSPPKLEKILEFFNELIIEGYEELLMVTASSQVSQTFEFINQAASMIDSRLRVVTFDTKSVGFSQSIFALAATRLSARGLPLDEIIVHLEEVRTKNCILASSDSVDYFLQSAQAVHSLNYRKSVFQVKPIVTLDKTGAPKVLAKTMSRDKAMSNMCIRAQEFINNRPFMVFVVSSSPVETEQNLKQKIKQYLKVDQVPIYPITPSLAVHVCEHFYSLGIFIR